MAWDCKWRSEFKDIYNLDWRIDIEDETAATTITSMQPTGTPLTINYLSSGDTLFDGPIHGSTVDINIYSTTDFQWATFYAYGEQKYRVSIYYGSGIGKALYWQGFINSEAYTEPYDGTAYPVIISASDGLGQLKNKLYKYQTVDPDDTYYNGRILESQIIIDILTKIQTTGFTEYVNIYEESMFDDDGDSPFDQVEIDVDVFRDMNCYEVLEHILRKYNACIRQVAGKMIIYRPIELTQSTVHGRVFTTATSKTPATNLTTEQLIDRPTAPTDLHSVDSGTLMIQAPVKKVTINQDYGNKESWLDNYQFKVEDWDGTDFKGWTRAGGVAITPINSILPGEKDGVSIASQYPTTTKYIYQTFASGAIVSATDYLKLELDYMYYNTSGSAKDPVYVYIEVISSDGKYLDIGLNDTTGTWVPYLAYTFIGDAAPEGIPEWKHWERIIPGIPTAGSYTIRILGTVNAYGVDVYTGIKNVKFYATSTKTLQKKVRRKLIQRIREHDPSRFFFGGYGPKYQTVDYKEPTDNVVEHNYIKTNAINGQELEINYILGDVPNVSDPVSDADVNIDNILEQFTGSLGVVKSETVSNSTYWNTRDGSESKPLLEIIGDEIASQHSRPKQQLSLPILELNNISTNPQIKLLGNFKDSLNTYSGNSRKFVFNSGTWNVRDRIFDLDLIEVI